MTVGLPGTGIGGLFYLFSALFMPIRELWRAALGKGRPRDLRIALRQAGMSLLIIATGWLTSLALTVLKVGDTHKESHLLALTFGTLVCVVLGVEALSATLRVLGRIDEQMSGQAPAPGGDR